jgi:hypothetical protein
MRKESKSHYQPIIDFLEEGISKGRLKNIPVDMALALAYAGISATVNLHLSQESLLTNNLLKQSIEISWTGLSN